MANQTFKYVILKYLYLKSANLKLYFFTVQRKMLRDKAKVKSLKREDGGEAP